MCRVNSNIKIRHNMGSYNRHRYEYFSTLCFTRAPCPWSLPLLSAPCSLPLLAPVQKSFLFTARQGGFIIVSFCSSHLRLIFVRRRPLSIYFTFVCWNILYFRLYNVYPFLQVGLQLDILLHWQKVLWKSYLRGFENVLILMWSFGNAAKAKIYTIVFCCHAE